MNHKRRRNRINAKGRNATSRFVRLDHRLLNSNAYRALSPNARSLLIELGLLYNGQNNGSLYLSVRDAAARMGVVDVAPALKAFVDLQDLGFIELTRRAYFRIKASEGSRARCWRLTWEAGPGRRPPSNLFYDREPAPKTRERKRMDRGLQALKVYRKARDANRLPVLDSDTLDAETRKTAEATVTDSRSLDCRSREDRPCRRDRDSRAHIAVTMGDTSSIDFGLLPPRIGSVSPVAGQFGPTPRRHSPPALPLGSILSWERNFDPRNQSFPWKAANDN